MRIRAKLWLTGSYCIIESNSGVHILFYIYKQGTKITQKCWTAGSEAYDNRKTSHFSPTSCIKLQYLKWQYHKICWHFFHESNPYGPLINMLKWFLLKVRFCGDIRELSDSAQANTARRKTLKKLNMLIFWKICGNPKLANTAWSQLRAG